MIALSFRSRCAIAAAAIALCGCGSEAAPGDLPQGGQAGKGGQASAGANTAAAAGNVSATGGQGLGGSGGDATSGASLGGGGSGGTAAVAGGGSAGQGGSPLPPVTDYSAPGPFATTTQADTGPNQKYTIIRPEPLRADGFLHAPIMFGPGTGMEVMQLKDMLARIASHGFVIIGARLDGGPGNPDSKATMQAGLDWILAQNSVPGSPFEGKLDVKHAIAMGYSVGGTAAVEIGGDEAVATVVSIHGHEAMASLHGPLLQTSGTADNIGLPLQQATFMSSQVQTFLGIVSGADHFYIQSPHDGVPGGVETPAIIAWLRYWIYDDQGGKQYFYGDDCVMCQPPWTTPQRKNWQ